MATQNSASSLDEKASFKGNNASVEAVDQKKGVDVTVDLVSGHVEEELSREQFKRIRWKLDWHLLPLIFLLYTLQFIDKNSLGSVAILGLMTDNHLTTNEFNNLGSAFYIGYIIFVWPHAWMMQRFPIAKWISLNIFLWSVFLGLHCVCHNYGGLFALRFLLGAAEGCITTGCMTVTSMFYDRTEVSERLAWTFQCNGIASIIANCVAFGIAHISVNHHPARWQWYMIFTSVISFLTSILFLVYFPDNPASARFLTPEEKIMVVQRLKSTQNGIETKVWKKYQVMEAIKDVKTWIFFFFAAISNLQGGLGIQYQIIIKDFGFNTLETTMLSIPMGFTMIFAITASTIWLHKCPNHRAWIGIAFFIPSIIACICLLALPQHNRGGRLAQIYIINMNGAGFIAILGWVAVSFAGHTKKMTVNAIFLVGYALGQALCTQFWKIQYRPRNIVPWSIQVTTYVIDIILILILRYLYVKENKRRDNEQAASGEEPEQFGYVEKVNDEGVTEKVKVPIQLLDITDTENRAFRYPL